MSKFQHITRAILARPWAIDPDSIAWAAILDVLSIRAAGEILTDAEIEARIAAASNGPRGGGGRSRNVAVIPVYGPISPRMSMMARSSGGTSAETIRDSFREALADADVDGIVFDVDSPGGVVEGIDELAAEIRAGRGQKPIAAVANHVAASAAYWIASAADEFVATPSATVGSIGVFTAHQDVSAALEAEGIRTTLISAGKYKTEGNRFEALGEEARAAIQADVDAWYGTMTASIAKGRGVSVDVVRGSAYGEGRSIMARKALDAGVIDRIDSLENTIRRVGRGSVGSKPADKVAGAPYLVGVEGPETFSWDAGVLLTHEDAAGAAVSFSDRVEAVAAEAGSLAGEARKRAELRADEGRSLSPAVRDGLVVLADSLRGIAEAEPDGEEPEEEPENPTPDEPAKVAIRGDLAILEAATAGGYVLPH